MAAGTMIKKPKREVDWEKISPHYRAGIRSLKDIGDEFGVSDAAIIKHAKKNGWERDLTARIREKAKAKVSAAVVSAEVSAQTKLTETIRIEIEAEVQSRMELTHRTDITRARGVAMSLLSELESQTVNHELFEQLGFMLRNEDDKGADKLNDLYHKVISMSGRTSNMKQLADTLKTLIDLERRAYGIDTRVGASEGLEDWLKKLDG